MVRLIGKESEIASACALKGQVAPASTFCHYHIFDAVPKNDCLLDIDDFAVSNDR
jgi:hypothetical protein